MATFLRPSEKNTRSFSLGSLNSSFILGERQDVSFRHGKALYIAHLQRYNYKFIKSTIFDDDRNDKGDIIMASLLLNV